MKGKPKVLFVSHDASRSGAPILLRNFCQEVMPSSIEGAFLLRRSGPLLEDFVGLGIVHQFSPPWLEWRSTLWGRFLNRLGVFSLFVALYRKGLLAWARRERFDLIYSNTIVNVDVLETLEPLGLSVLTHVRELESTIREFGGKSHIQKLNQLSTKFIADSQPVKDNLVRSHGISSNKIEVVDEYVDIPTVLPDQVKAGDVLAELGIDHETFVIGSCGGALWRKGYDLFLSTAISVLNGYPERKFCFVWIGGISEVELTKMRFDIEKSGHSGRILFTGARANVSDYFSMFDLFFLASREEAFGIVGMEAALFETPVLCFEGAGGMAGFVKSDCGVVLPYGDICAAADKIVELADNPKQLEQLGVSAKEKVVNEHSLERKSRDILNVMAGML